MIEFYRRALKNRGTELDFYSNVEAAPEIVKKKVTFQKSSNITR